MTSLVGLCGYAGAGKDTAALGLVDAGWTRIAFADALKDVARVLGWDGQKDEAGREFLQRLGTEAVREKLHPEAWVWALEHRCIQAYPAPVVVTDVRFPNEVAWIKRMGGLLAHIVRPGVDPVNQHISELAWNGADFDAVIQNDGPAELVQQRLREVVQ